MTDVIRRYLDCEDLHFGFARVKCEDCGNEY
jgi:ribosomal protein S27E